MRLSTLRGRSRPAAVSLVTLRRLTWPVEVVESIKIRARPLPALALPLLLIGAEHATRIGAFGSTQSCFHHRLVELLRFELLEHEMVALCVPNVVCRSERAPRDRSRPLEGGGENLQAPIQDRESLHSEHLDRFLRFESVQDGLHSHA